MGNIIDTLMSYVFNRRQNANAASHSPTDHPEELPPNQLPPPNPINPTAKLSISSISTISTLKSRAVTRRSADVTSELDLTTISIERRIIPPVEIDIISSSVTTIEHRCSDFYIACRTNDIDKVKELLPRLTLSDIDRLEPNGSTALHSASYHGHEEIVELLLKVGVDRAIHNIFGCLPFDEAKNDKIKRLFLRIPNTDRFLSNTGSIEWDLITDDALETAAEIRHDIQSIYNNTSGLTSIDKMFEKIYKNYITDGLINFDGNEKIIRFFRKAIKEQDPKWIIKAYTAETEFYKILNKEIAGGASRFQNERRYIITLLIHHPKLDELTYVGHSYRVLQITQDDLNKYERNSCLMTKSFLSSCIDQKIAELFILRKEHAERGTIMPVRTRVDGTIMKFWVMCIYHIKHPRTALHIENSSQYANEGEILIMPYSVFKIKRINHMKPLSVPIDQKMTQIEFEECDPFLVNTR
ncbi:unnamed protein product [Adineta steineri]|uniref:Uncharacterized protein n=1 Tax=Adineta steineri TaxID=433720 RepID=A0A814Z3T9_9BILA|nr:unnamed protein product [Adineta steineri]